MSDVVAGLGIIHRSLSLALSYPRADRVEKLRETLERSRPLFRGGLAVALRRMGGALPAAGDERAREELASHHVELFDGGGKITPCATEAIAGKMSVKTNRLADLAGFYAAFGFRGGATGGGEAPDHVAVMLEFLAFLSLKVAYERAAGAAERLAIAADARRAFLTDHAGPFGLHFAARLARRARHPLYASAAELLAAALAFEARLAGGAWRPFASAAKPGRVPAADGRCGFAGPGGREHADAGGAPW